ncbi:MAG: HDOD domain-containing protein [Spirochaetaceae bacterium]|jgi:HD-like signal output (HDOD) protein|nr:HDOD domain-containing protein [Spirochaetaceae bacterium]
MTGNTKSASSRRLDDEGMVFRHYPVIMPSALKIYDICKSGKLNPYDLFTIINADPVLTGITYGLYHEFFPEMPRDFFGIPHIIIKLNVNTVKNNVLKAVERTMARQKADKKTGNKQMDFLRRSLAAGIVSLLLAKRRGITGRGVQEYYCAGLLHDIGGFALSQESGVEFTGTGGGITTAEAGRLTAKLWGFPPGIHDVIAFHQDYTSYTGNYQDAVRHTALAVSISDKWAAVKSTASRLQQPVPAELFKLLGLSENIFEEIEKPFRAEFKKTAAFIGLEGV